MLLTETRKRILQHVYEMNVKDPYAVYFPSQKIIESLGLREDEYTFDVNYLVGEGLLKPFAKAHGKPWPFGVNITHEGKKLVESQFGEHEPQEKALHWSFFVKGNVPEVRLILIHTDVGPKFRIRGWHPVRSRPDWSPEPAMEDHSVGDICLITGDKPREMSKVGQLILEARPRGRVEVILESDELELEVALWNLWEKMKNELAAKT